MRARLLCKSVAKTAALLLPLTQGLTPKLLQMQHIKFVIMQNVSLTCRTTGWPSSECKVDCRHSKHPLSSAGGSTAGIGEAGLQQGEAGLQAGDAGVRAGDYFVKQGAELLNQAGAQMQCTPQACPDVTLLVFGGFLG